MTRALIGSFWTALFERGLGLLLVGEATARTGRGPGLTTATQNSGLPLPEPMRVSAGFFVTGLSGKMLIHTLPPRLMARVMAIRAASIWRAVSQPGSSAWMPYSPKRQRRRRPWSCRRCGRGGACGARPCGASTWVSPPHGSAGLRAPAWVRRAISSSSSSSFSNSGSASLTSGAASTSPSSAGGGRPTTRPCAAPWPDVSPTAMAASRAILSSFCGLVGHDVALVDPDLDADAAAGGLGLAEAVVDVGAQRVQRHPTFAVPLGAAHLGATEAARALHADAEGAGLLGVLHGALHRPAEGDAVDQLVGDALGDQRGVELGALDLDDVQLHLRVAGDLGEQGAQLVGLGATATDDDAGAGRVDVDADLVTGALDLDAADRGASRAWP